MFRNVLWLTMSLLLVSAAGAVNWQTGAPEATGSYQVICALSGAPASLHFERNVLGEGVVEEFLADFDCWRLDLDQPSGLRAARALRITTAPTVLIRNQQGTEVWRAEGEVTARELITALVINGPVAGTGSTTVSTPPPASTNQLSSNEPSSIGPPLATDPAGDASPPAADLVQGGVTTSGGSLVVMVRVAGQAQIDGFHLFIDSDGNRSTGYDTTNIGGADVMIEGGTLYRHAGANANDWNWNQIGTAMYESAGSTLTVRAPMATLGLASGDVVNVAFSTTGADWATADSMPDYEPCSLTIP